MLDPFKDIDQISQEKLLKDLESSTYHFKKDTPISSTIMLQDTLGIVLQGSLQAIKTDYNGNRFILETINERSIFSNSISFLLDENCELWTLEDTTIITFDYYQIINYGKSDEQYYHQFILNLFEIINYIVTLKNERIRVLTQKTIRNKLLEYFDICFKKTGSKIIYLPFSFTDLADYLAVDRSAMTRELKHLKEEKIITIKSKKITLLSK